MRTLLAFLLVSTSIALPLIAFAAEKQLADVGELAGTCQGWVTAESGQDRVTHETGRTLYERMK